MIPPYVECHSTTTLYTVIVLQKIEVEYDIVGIVVGSVEIVKGIMCWRRGCVACPPCIMSYGRFFEHF